MTADHDHLNSSDTSHMTIRRLYRGMIVALVGMLLVGCEGVPDPPTPTRSPTAPPLDRAPAPIPTRANVLGVHLLLDDGRSRWPVTIWPEHLRYAREAVGEWGYAVQVIRGDDLDPARWQTFMDQCAALHLTPVLRLATVFDRQAGWWTAPTPDADGSYRSAAAAYAAFIAALDWPTEAHLVIVGNEPNHGDEWGGQPDPAAYARFLIDVADALHAADRGARVLNAGLDPYAPHSGGLPLAGGPPLLDAETFLEGMVAAYPGVFARLDAWASHAYPPGPFTAAPWEQQFRIDRLNGDGSAQRDLPPGMVNRGVNAYAWELYKLAELGAPTLPVFITETGWRHAESVDADALDNAPADLPPAEIVAVYLDLALNGNHGRYPDLPEDGWTPWLDDPRVIGVAFFALNGVPAEWGHTNWLWLDESGAVHGVYPMFEQLATISMSF